MDFLSTGRKQALAISTIAVLFSAAWFAPPTVPAAGAQTRSPADVMQMRALTTNDIMAKIRRRQTTPISKKLSVGEVGSINDEEAQCFKKRSSGLVRVKCPDVIIVNTK